MELKRIGRYDIKSLIGQGGMSAVYLGYDPRSHRDVAIKVLPPYYLHATKFRERFEREALTIALLEHPAIVPVYDMGEEDGQPYIVMRYMSGGSLAERLKKGAVPLKDGVDMMVRLAPALDAAHARGVIHRDVKPDNVLFDQYGTVFLSDFGLARLKESIGFANISDGSIMGTPAYMSPEQIQGDRELDGRSDIYSMGVVLYHMLCGTVPYTGSTAASVMMMHLINPVPHVYEKNESLPTAIQVVLDTAMAKNPDDRFQTAGELARALQDAAIGFLKGVSQTAAEATPAPVPAKPSTLIFPTKELDASAVTPVAQSALPPPEIAIKPAEVVLPAVKEAPIAVEAVLPEEKATPRIPEAALQAEEMPFEASAAEAEALPARRLTIPTWGWIAGGAVVLVLLLAFIFGGRNLFAVTPRPTSTSAPTKTVVQVSPTPVPTIASSPTPLPLAIVLGGADKIAFLNASNIWVSNLDGSVLVQLTTDGAAKSNLQWSPDGESILYTAANCIHLVKVQTQQVSTLTCLSGVSSIDTLDLSPDGKKIALSLNQNDLYLLTYDQLLRLRQASFPEDLQAVASCQSYAPFHVTDDLRSVRWSLDGTSLALVLSMPSGDVNRDGLRLLDFSRCAESPTLVGEILPTYFLFTLRGYYDHPEIPSFDWDGKNLLLLSGYLRQDGFGDLLLYNLGQTQSQTINPNQGLCCYRDAQWSPDGTYLLYAYQPEAGDEIRLYYVPYPEITQPGAAANPLPLPTSFFANQLESLQLALRVAP